MLVFVILLLVIKLFSCSIEDMKMNDKIREVEKKI